MLSIQVLLPDNVYAQRLLTLIAREGDHEGIRVAAPDFHKNGVFVADRSAIERFPRLLEDVDRLVLITSNDTRYLASLWERGVRSVVFDSDPPSTALLAILALEMRGGLKGVEPSSCGCGGRLFPLEQSHPPAGPIGANRTH